MLLSLVVPIRGDANEIAQLAIARTVSLDKVEWILVLDGDPSPVVSGALEGVADRRDITVVRQERGGPGRARNAGLECAEGQVVAFLDSDDVADVRLFARLASDMTDRGARVGVVGYSISANHPAGTALECHVPEMGWQDPVPLLRHRAGVWRFAFDRSFLIETGIRFPAQSYAEDLVFLIRVLEAGERAWGLPVVAYSYRLHSDSPLTRQRPAEVEVASTLDWLGQFVPPSTSPEFGRIVLSWRARIWLRHHHGVANASDFGMTARMELLKGLAWSIAWVVNSPRRIETLSRMRMRMRMGRGEWRAR